MAGVKITDLTPLATAASDDLLYIVDVSDTSESPQGTSKKIEVGNVARPYKVYTALLTQEGVDAPTAIELENTIEGTISFTYINTGTYEIVNSNVWDFDKIWYTIGGLGNVGTNTSNPGRAEIGRESNSLLIFTFSNELYDTIDYNPIPINTQMSNTSIEIRVYN